MTPTPHVELEWRAHRVARAMLVLGGWLQPAPIAREIAAQYEATCYWLQRLRQGRFAERRKRRVNGGYEWQLTALGAKFAAAATPEGTSQQAPRVRYDHRPLAAAMGMAYTIITPPGRVHSIRVHRI